MSVLSHFVPVALTHTTQGQRETEREKNREHARETEREKERERNTEVVLLWSAVVVFAVLPPQSVRQSHPS